MQKLWHTGIDKLKAYVPGKAIEDVKEELGHGEVFRLASNENPYGPSEKSIIAMQEAIRDGHLYPEATSRELRKKLGKLYGVDSNQVVVSNGADNIITMVGQAYINKDDEVIYCTPTFAAYRTITTIMNGIPVEIPTTEDYRFDLEAILEKITERTKLIFICNPNNPTGTIVDSDAMKSFLDRLPDHVIVVMDEAYGEFIDEEGYQTGIDFGKQGYPVLTIRTFSKLYGLAGLRVGYIVGTVEMLKPVLAVREPFAVNRIGHDAAVAALEDTAYKEKILAEVKKEKAFLMGAFEKMGLDVTPSYTNFLFVNLKRDASFVFEQLMQKGILIRPCAAWGYPEYARITIGTREQNEFVIEEMEKLLEGVR